jgi:hypothetical protein
METAEWFREIDEELDNDNLIRDRVDERGKLTKQPDMAGKYLVQSGASGAIPCASVYKHPEDDFPFVTDQTLYTFLTESELEAYYLVGMLNSRAVEEQIDKFQSRGDFAKRHIHKLPYRIIPQFCPEDRIHQEIAESAMRIEKHAEDQLTDYITDLTNLLHIRRKKLSQRLDVTLLNELTRLVKVALEGK